MSYKEENIMTLNEYYNAQMGPNYDFDLRKKYIAESEVEPHVEYDEAGFPTKINGNEMLIFIVPNRAVYADQFCIRKDELKKEAMVIAEANGCTYNEKTDKLYEVWLVGMDKMLREDNLQDHHPSVNCRMVKDTGDDMRVYPHFPRRLPKTVIDLIKEGEMTEITLPVWSTSIPQEDENKMTGIIEIKANILGAQKVTRYSSFGTWEECVRRVS